MGEHVTIGVPIYHGAPYLEEALRSIRAQTHRDFDVIMSVDGPDPECEAIARRFLADGRFRLEVQPERLGWYGHINWLMAAAGGDFWYFHQQDDLVSENYLELLTTHARDHSEAALVYCDIQAFGTLDRVLIEDSLMGESAFARFMTYFHEHYEGYAFRGLARMDAVRAGGPIPGNEFEGMGGDSCWTVSLARTGELHRVPLKLYRKRYHAENTHMKWIHWPTERKLAAWACHCLAMFEEALPIAGSFHEMRLLWLATLQRLASPRTAGHYLRAEEMSPGHLEAMLELFLGRARTSIAAQISAALGAKWPDIEKWSRVFFQTPT